MTRRMEFIVVGAMLFVLLYCTLCIRLSKDSIASDLVNRTYPVARAIYENRREGEACKELNMNLYIYLRSKGYHPDVQIGTKNGEGHLWLELDGLIFDATDPQYFGQPVERVNSVYVPDSRIIADAK